MRRKLILNILIFITALLLVPTLQRGNKGGNEAGADILPGSTKVWMSLSDAFTYDSSGNLNMAINDLTVETIESHSPVKVIDGLLLLRASDRAKEFHIFMSGEDTNSLSLSSAFDNTMIFATHGAVDNANDMSIVFWNGKDSRPILTLDQGGVGRANFFERSLIIGDGKGAKALDGSYTLGTSTYPNLSFDTATYGADLGVEHDLEVLGTIYTPTLRADLIKSEYELYINSNSEGNVRIFDGVDIADATDGKRLYIYRRAAEGDSYMDFHIHRDQEAHFNSNVDMVFTDGITECLRISTADHKVNAPFGLTSGGVDVLTSYTETDPIFTAWDKSTGISITESQISDLSHFGGYISDLLGASDERVPFASGFGGLTDSPDFKYNGSKLTVGSSDSNKWASAYGWGDHSIVGYLTSYTETDPVFSAWDKSTGISILESQISDLTHTAVFDGDITEIYNSLGDLKIMPDVQGDVVLFGDTDVDDAVNGKMLYVRRQAVEGDNYVRLYVGNDTTGVVSASSNLTIHGEDSVTLHSATKDVIFRIGDDAGAKKAYFKNTSNGIVGYVDSLGNAQFNASIDVPEIYNNSGDLKIMPDVQGDVILFGDANIDNAVDGKEIKIWRKASEGNSYVRLYVTNTDNALMHSDTNMLFQNASGKNIQFNSGQHIYFNLGDQAGSDEVRIRDSAGLEVGIVDSNGNAWLRGDVSIGVSSDVLIQANGDSYFNGGNVGFGGNITVSGTVDGIDIAALSSSVSNVDNTSDADKPISTSTQTALDLKASLASPSLTGNVTVDGNYVIEGDSDAKNIVRKIQLQVRDGATPGTNIDITKFTTQGRAYNAPAITDADDLAKSGTSGSYSLSANGENLTLDFTETVHTVLSCTVVSDDLNNGGGGGYYVHTLVISDNIQIMVEKSGSETNLDWTDVTNTASDFVIFDIAFMTST